MEDSDDDVDVRVVIAAVVGSTVPVAMIAGSVAAAVVFCGILRRAHQAAVPAAVPTVDIVPDMNQNTVNPLAEDQGVAHHNPLDQDFDIAIDD